MIKSTYHYELGGCVDGSWVVCPEVEILGWSKESLVAYTTSNGSLANPGRCVIIQDVISDEILENECDLKINEINLLLNHYKIINQGAKYYSQISSYDIDLITIPKETEDCPAQDIEYQINISHPTHGDKIVGDGVYSCVNDLGVFGYFKSPFEERILIILYYMPFPVEWETYFINGYGSSLKSNSF